MLLDVFGSDDSPTFENNGANGNVAYEEGSSSSRRAASCIMLMLDLRSADDLLQQTGRIKALCDASGRRGECMTLY